MVSVGLLLASAALAVLVTYGVARSRGLRKGGEGCGRRPSWR